jgi:hypothetical protein
MQINIWEGESSNYLFPSLGGGDSLTTTNVTHLLHRVASLRKKSVAAGRAGASGRSERWEKGGVTAKFIAWLPSQDYEALQMLRCYLNCQIALVRASPCLRACLLVLPRSAFKISVKNTKFTEIEIRNKNGGVLCRRRVRLTTVETCFGTAAKLRQTTRACRRYIAAKVNFCSHKAYNIYSAPLYICRVILLLLRQRRSRPWRTGMGTWPKRIFCDRTRSHPARFERDIHARATGISCFLCQKFQ